MQIEPENQDQKENETLNEVKNGNSNEEIAKQIPTVTPDNDNDDLQSNPDHED